MWALVKKCSPKIIHAKVWRILKHSDGFKVTVQRSRQNTGFLIASIFFLCAISRTIESLGNCKVKFYMIDGGREYYQYFYILHISIYVHTCNNIFVCLFVCLHANTSILCSRQRHIILFSSLLLSNDLGSCLAIST